MRMTIIAAFLTAANVAMTAVNWNPPAAEADVKPMHPIFADGGGPMARRMVEYDTIKAKQIMLVDEKGYPAIHMIAGRNASGIWVSDGKQNAAMYVTDHQGPVLALMDNRNVSKGAPLAFSLDRDAKPIVQVIDGDRRLFFDAVKLAPKK